MSGESGQTMYGPDVGITDRDTHRGVFRGRSHGFHAPFPERQLILAFGDLLAIFVAVIVITQIVDPLLRNNTTLLLVRKGWAGSIVCLGIWFGFAFLNDLYDMAISSRRRTTAYRIFLTGVFSATGCLLASTLLYGPSLPNHALVLIPIAMLAVSVWRIVYTGALRAGLFRHRIVIFGAGTRAHTVMELLSISPELDFEVVGCVSEESNWPVSSAGSIRVMGQAKSLPRLIREIDIHEIVLAPEGKLNLDHIECLTACLAKGVPLTYMPDLYARLQRRVPIEEIDVDWALHAIQSQELCWRLNLAIKRTLDMLLLLVGLPIFLLLTPFVALAIRLDSRGPIIYRQVRCGRGAEPFQIFKFRTMICEAEADGIAKWATENDCRITRVGRILRKSHLDELPQLVNVLFGDMSFVGPRPERPEFVAELKEKIPYYDARMLVKPGITGWAQVHYDYGNSVGDAQIKLQYDFFYVNHWSLWMDLYILYRTPAEALKLNGT